MTFVGLGLSRPMRVAGGGWCWCLVALAVRRSEWCCQQNKRFLIDVFFLLVSTFLPSRHDVFRNSTAAAVSCVLMFELIRGLGLICCEIKLIHGIEE